MDALLSPTNPYLDRYTAPLFGVNGDCCTQVGVKGSASGDARWIPK